MRYVLEKYTKNYRKHDDNIMYFSLSKNKYIINVYLMDKWTSKTREIAAFLIFILSLYGCGDHKEKPLENMHVSETKGKEWNVFGVKIIGKILSEDTNGAYSVIITETPPNGGPPLHIHTHEDELFYVLKGNFDFFYGDKKIATKKGDFMQLPKGTPHRFVNTDSITGITMNTITPGGFENFFDDIAKFSKTQTLSKPKIDSIANTYGIKFFKK